MHSNEKPLVSGGEKFVPHLGASVPLACAFITYCDATIAAHALEVLNGRLCEALTPTFLQELIFEWFHPTPYILQPSYTVCSLET